MSVVVDIRTGHIDHIPSGDRFVVPEGQMVVVSHLLVEGELVIDPGGHVILVP